MLLVLGEGEGMGEGGASGIATLSAASTPAQAASVPALKTQKDDAMARGTPTQFVIVAFMKNTVVLRDPISGETRQFAEGDRLPSGETITSISEWRSVVHTDQRDIRMGG